MAIDATDLGSSADALRRLPVTRAETRRQLGWTLCIALAATLPFLDKAFHIDDILYLRVAQQILRTPWDPYGGRENAVVLWDAKDGQPASLFQTDFNPPLWKYVLAGVIALFGRDEWVLHLVQSVFVWIAAAGLLRVGQRFTPAPVWCVALVLVGPFFLPGQNLMLEPSLLCFVVWGIELALRDWTEQKTQHGWNAGLLLAAAMLTKYTAGLILLVVASGALIFRQPRSLVRLLFPPLAAVLMWNLHNRLTHDQTHLVGHGVLFRPEEWPVRALTVLRCIGGLSVFGPAVALALIRGGRVGQVAFAGCVVTAAAVSLADVHWIRAETPRSESQQATVSRLAHAGLFTFHGAFTLLGLAAVWAIQGRSQSIARGRLFLITWLALMFVFNVACVPFNAVRHLLLFLTPLVWLSADLLAEVFQNRVLANGTLAASTFLGLVLALADYEIAGMYRNVAEQRIGPHAAAGRTVWFTGNWGFAYYCSQAGAFPVVDNPEKYGLPAMRAGDVAFNPKLLTWTQFPPERFRPVRVIEHMQPEAINPFRTIAPGVHYYAVAPHALCWQLVAAPVQSDVERAFFELPPLDDILVFEVQ